jgi:hypothetical protein
MNSELIMTQLIKSKKGDATSDEKPKDLREIHPEDTFIMDLFKLADVNVANCLTLEQMEKVVEQFIDFLKIADQLSSH